jgi:aminoglycoside phosphotransferase (APT) family kinase protein
VPPVRDVGVPTTVDALLDVDWLHQALDLDAADRIVRAEVVDASQTLAQKVRFEVEIESADGAHTTRALCAKAHLDGSPGTDLITEAHFYRELAPQLEVRMPTPYYAAVDADADQAIIIMDDVVALGGRFLNAHTPYALDTVRDTLGQLASLHATTWGPPAFADRDWLAPRIADLTGRFPPELLQSLLDDGRAPDVVPELRDAVTVTEATRRVGARDATCVIHGDTQSGNAYLDRAGRACWLDWQIAQRGRWSTDVAYHLSTVLEVDTRRAHERELLEHYLGALEIAGGPALPPDEAWDDYTLGFAYGYFLWCITRVSSREVVLIHMPRIAAALTDHDTYRRLGVV